VIDCVTVQCFVAGTFTAVVIDCVTVQCFVAGTFTAVVIDCVTVLESELLKMIAAALTDFADLNCYAALQLLLEVSKTSTGF